jgi:hypothetical protein
MAQVALLFFWGALHIGFSLTEPLAEGDAEGQRGMAVSSS